MTKKRRVKPSKSPRHGIPAVLATIRYEKVSEVVPVKLPLSLKEYITQVAGDQGVSGWIRSVILEKLQHMTEEA